MAEEENDDALNDEVELAIHVEGVGLKLTINADLNSTMGEIVSALIDNVKEDPSFDLEAYKNQKAADFNVQGNNVAWFISRGKTQEIIPPAMLLSELNPPITKKDEFFCGIRPIPG